MSQTSRIRIELDNTLEQKTVSDFANLEVKSKLDLKTPNNYFSQYEYSERLLCRQNHDYRTQNNFINAFLNAYNYHKTLVLRPDDIKLQILTIISICVNNNAEKYRSYFVDHDGKKELIVKSPVFSADYFCQKFAELLDENIKDKNFASHYTSRFTTTNQIISTVNNITLMNTLKEYFSFTMMLDCGIPAVVLEGTDEDWVKLNESYQYFKSVFGDSELKDWFRQFDKIMELFMMMRKINLPNETQSIWSSIMSYIITTNNTNNCKNEENLIYIKEMWKRVISYIPQGSGGDKILGGWVRLFVPYNSKNKLIGGLDKDLAMFDLTKSEPSKNNDYYKWQDKMKEFYFGADWTEMFSSFITTPANLIDYDGCELSIDANLKSSKDDFLPEKKDINVFYSDNSKRKNLLETNSFETEYKVESYSGFFDPHITESDEIHMNIGYIVREDQQIKKDKMKKHYIREGVKNRENGFGLEIPKKLQKKIHEILDVFDAHCYNYVGVDPEEEDRKEYYIAEGVKKEIVEYQFGKREKYFVPEKFKDNKIALQEIKKLFNIYNVKYY